MKTQEKMIIKNYLKKMEREKNAYDSQYHGVLTWRQYLVWVIGWTRYQAMDLSDVPCPNELDYQTYYYWCKANHFDPQAYNVLLEVHDTSRFKKNS